MYVLEFISIMDKTQAIFKTVIKILEKATIMSKLDKVNKANSKIIYKNYNIR
jgi:hypothetical protein